MKIVILPKQIVTADNQNTILTNTAIEIVENKISSFIPFDKLNIYDYQGEVIQVQHLTIVPGFIQTHIHLCQTMFRGLADDLELLDWLQQRIFPYENAHTKESLKLSSSLGIYELQKGGTTTILDMGTLRHQEVIFEELIHSGMRAFAGKCMIDENDLFPDFKNSTKTEIDETYRLAKQFHNSSDGKIKYGFAPRFVLSCSEKLLKETSAMMKDFNGSLFHTHSSENKNEIIEVKKRYGKENIEYFDSIGILNENTLLAHCIHVNENEIASLKRTKTRVAHCPSSNFKLGSGIANIPRYINEGISVSLGADGAPCNNNLSVFKEMNLAALMQKPFHGPTCMDAKTVFRLATIEGAKALHIEKETGSIEIGKKADLVLLDLDKPGHNLLAEEDNVYSDIVYSASSSDVTDVMINGKWVVRNGESIHYDEMKLYADSKSALQKLLGNAKV